MDPIEGKEDIGDVEEIEIGEDGTISESPEAEPSKEASTKFSMPGIKFDMDNVLFPYGGQLLAGVVLLVAITVGDEDKNRSYGIAASVIAMIFALAAGFITQTPEINEKQLGSFPIFGTLTVGGAIAQFLFVWWFIAAGILTFNGPFLITSNGYFASWGGVFFAALALGVTMESFHDQVRGLGYLQGILVAGIILISATPTHIGGPNNGEAIYALVVAIFTVLLVLAFTRTSGNLEKFKFPAYIGFALIWFVMACLVTFRGPFSLTGNGYFASWIGTFLFAMAVNSSRETDEEDASV